MNKRWNIQNNKIYDMWEINKDRRPCSVFARASEPNNIYIRGTHNQRHVLHTKYIRCHCKQSSNVNKQQQIHRILFINLQHEWWVAIFPHKTHTQNPKWDRFTMQKLSRWSRCHFNRNLTITNVSLSSFSIYLLGFCIYSSNEFILNCVLLRNVWHLFALLAPSDVQNAIVTIEMFFP